MKRIAALVALLAMASGVAGAQSPKRHFLWAVRAPGAPVTYLMGSLHVLTPGYYPLAPAIEKAFSESTVLIEEVDLDELTNPPTLMALLGRAMLTEGRTLDQVIAPELYKQVIARAEQAGIPAIAIQRMKPWMAALSLTVPALKQAGYDPNLGVDRHFFDKAKARKIEHRGLETAAYQFERFDQMAMPLQEAMLKAVMADLDTQLGNVKEIAEAWASGQTASIERLMLSAFLESPEMYERLLVERNRNWVAPVENCLQTKTACFVVVGAAHLVGPHSLVALLQKKGYQVEQQ